jgi:hypothetical protein
MWAGMARLMALIWAKREGDYFCKWDWTGSLSDLPGGQNHFESSGTRALQYKRRGPTPPYVSLLAAESRGANQYKRARRTGSFCDYLDLVVVDLVVVELEPLIPLVLAPVV